MLTQAMMCRFLLALAHLAPITAIRSQASENAEGSTTSTVYNVSLLITRHGLSCTNIAEKWISSYDIGRGRIHDPLLSGAGEYSCQESGKVVEAWLQDHQYTIDAVLSSNLARAMETAILMFPKNIAPLYVVPYIREDAIGYSNAPKEHKEQLQSLQGALNKPLNVEYRGVDMLNGEKGTWTEFMYYLEQYFLPAFLNKHEKPSGTRIVLPVVTHSLFMRDSIVGERCGHAWTSKNEKKPLNNQVVNMPYTFEIKESADNDVSMGVQKYPVFAVTGCGDKRANGLWVVAGLSNGRPWYKHMQDSNFYIEWSTTDQTWSLMKTSMMGMRRSQRYFSKVNEPTVPASGWTTAWKQKGPPPQIKLRNKIYKFQDATETRCDEVSPGANVKGTDGKLRGLCMKDIGKHCIKVISDYSMRPSVLWDQTYEQKIHKTNVSLQHNSKKLANMNEKIESQGSDSDTEKKEDLENKISNGKKRMAELISTTCWIGGNPSVS